MSLSERLASAKTERTSQLARSSSSGTLGDAPSLAPAGWDASSDPRRTGAETETRQATLELTGDGLTIDLTDRVEPPEVEVTETVSDLTDPNSVLSWKWQEQDYELDEIPDHGAAWASYHERSKQRRAEIEAGDEPTLPDNGTWTERYRAKRQH